ncbi:MAG: metallophosphoesterase [Peptostreptococcus sp.]|uniref:metallophosphoesterase n=1 Tax=Peptostreptococcus sp. TaxID=1262 RepID=UPI002FC76420
MYGASFFLLFLGIIAYFYVEANYLEVTRFSIKSDKLVNKFKGKKIVQLGDLHGKSFGKNNERLIELIDKERPDVVFITGDMIEADRKNYQAALALLKDLSKKYKVFYVTGNHEHKALEKKYKDEYMEYFRQVKDLDIERVNNQKLVLDPNFKVFKRETLSEDYGIKSSNNMIDSGELAEEDDSIDEKDIDQASFAKKKKQKKYRYLNLYGLVLPFDSYRYMFSNRKSKEINKEYIEHKLGKLDKDECNFLLAHNPLLFDEYAKWGPDYVFSGHVHGGIVRIAKKGLFSPDRKFFPKYSFGEYERGNSKMFVTKGLGSSALKVRINCRPEILSIKFE